MRQLTLVSTIIITLLLAGCGGQSGVPIGPSPAPVQKVIDPSGNWMMTATDSNGNKANFAMIFSQSGSVVSNPSALPIQGTSPSEPDNTSSFDCVSAPDILSLALSNATVQNTSNFTGSMDLEDETIYPPQDFGTFTFNTTLVSSGLSFSGIYSTMPSCTGVAASGTFSGEEVPSVTGSWTGTLQPCTMTSGGTCASTGNGTETIAATLTQDDQDGAVSGPYTVTGDSELTSGNVGMSKYGIYGCKTSVGPGILSGTTMDLTWQDSSTSAYASMTGTLDMNGNYSGFLAVTPASSQTCEPNEYLLVTMSHPIS